jgi:hypothetical protein
VKYTSDLSEKGFGFMKTVKIVPAICKLEGSNWEGHVIMRLPSFDEKFEYMESLEIEVSASGEVETNKGSRLKQVRKMVKMSLPHYVEVNLKNNATGEHVQSVEEMQYVEDLHPTLTEIAGSLIGGFKVGNG